MTIYHILCAQDIIRVLNNLGLNTVLVALPVFAGMCVLHAKGYGACVKFHYILKYMKFKAKPIDSFINISQACASPALCHLLLKS